MASDGIRTRLVSMFESWERDSPSPLERHVKLTPPTDMQLDLLTQFMELHKQYGLVDGTAPLAPAVKYCRYGQECWADCEHADWQHAIPLPWIGARYEPNAKGVATVGLNLNDASGSLIEFEISERDMNSFQDGKSGASPRPSQFAKRSAYTARVLLHSGLRRSIKQVQEMTLPDALKATARIQLVKCSPAERKRSLPTKAMLRNCTQSFLGSEIDILRPGVLNGLGVDARRALQHLGAELEDEKAGLWIGTLERGWGTVSVVCTPHPASYGNTWQEAHDQLVARITAGSSNPL